MVRPQTLDRELRETPGRSRIDAAANAEHISSQVAVAQIVRQKIDPALDFAACVEFGGDVHFSRDAGLARGWIGLSHDRCCPRERKSD
ncbi:hypothetical protein OKW38_007367 [Paraburkholderia sp. MM5496-R1]